MLDRNSTVRLVVNISRRLKVLSILIYHLILTEGLEFHCIEHCSKYRRGRTVTTFADIISMAILVVGSAGSI